MSTLQKSFVYVDTIQRHLNDFQLKTIKGSRDFHCVENTGVPLTLMSMQTVVCAGNNYKSPAFQSLVTFCLQFDSTFYVLLILLILLLHIFIMYIYINCFFRCCRSHHPGTCPNIDIVKQYKKKMLNYKLPDIQCQTNISKKC